MERINENEAAPIIYNFNPDNILRCPECSLICSLKLNYLKDGQSKILYNCERNHSGNKPLKNYLDNNINNALSKKKCNECQKNINQINGDFFYCSKCDYFLCNLCQIKHPNGDKHNVINYKKYDTICKKHGNTFSFYCNDCKNNICIFCQGEHKNHNIKNLFDVNFSDEEKRNIKNKMNEIYLTLSNLDLLINNLSSILKQLKESIEIFKFYNYLLSSYDYEEKQHNLNYYLIENIKNFQELLRLNPIDSFNSLNNQFNKCNTIFQNISNINLNKNIKNDYIILDMTENPYYINKLKDGRLMCGFEGGSLKIYKKDTFEVQLTINEHKKSIYFFNQLHDERIITCSTDNTMKVIKLIENNKYKVNDTLIGHSSSVCKVIEIKNNELVSISDDKSIKIWKLNENKFNCINTKIISTLDYSTYNMIKINENEFVTSSSSDKILFFWNSNNYSNNIKINNLEINSNPNNMILLNNDLLCVAGNSSKGFFFIKISTHQLIKQINGPKYINSMFYSFENIFLCSISNENINKELVTSLVKYKYENGELKILFEKMKGIEEDFDSVIEINDKIISIGFSYFIRLIS